MKHYFDFLFSKLNKSSILTVGSSKFPLKWVLFSILFLSFNLNYFILRANEVFRVFVVMPLLPGFEGEVGGPSGTSLHAITHWNYSSISQ